MDEHGGANELHKELPHEWGPGLRDTQRPGLTVIPLGVCVIAAFFLHEPPPAATSTEEQEESHYFWVFNSLAIVVAVYLLAYDFIPSPNTVFSLVFTAILLVLLASPQAIPIYYFFKNWSGPGGDVEGQVREPLLVVEEEEEEEEKATESRGKEDDLMTREEVAGVKKKPVIGEEHKIMEALRTVDFWIENFSGTRR